MIQYSVWFLVALLQYRFLLSPSLHGPEAEKSAGVAFLISNN